MYDFISRVIPLVAKVDPDLHSFFPSKIFIVELLPEPGIPMNKTLTDVFSEEKNKTKNTFNVYLIKKGTLKLIPYVHMSVGLVQFISMFTTLYIFEI